MAKKTVLITGASGFVGRPLIDQLLKAGYSVRVTARVAHTNLREADSYKFDRVNRLATEYLARAAREAGIERFIFISSVRAQTGAFAKSVVRESDASLPTNDYGRSKLAAEFAVRTSGVPFTIFRPVAIYGPHPRGNIKSLVRLALSPLPIPFLGLTGRRSIIGIDNFISALLFALDNPSTVGEIYLVADQNSFTLAEVVAMLRKAVGRRSGMFNVPPIIINFVLTLLNRSELWARLGESLIVDTAKLQALGWRPTSDTYVGIVAMMRVESEKENQPAPKR